MKLAKILFEVGPELLESKMSDITNLFMREFGEMELISGTVTDSRKAAGDPTALIWAYTPVESRRERLQAALDFCSELTTEDSSAVLEITDQSNLTSYQCGSTFRTKIEGDA